MNSKQKIAMAVLAIAALAVVVVLVIPGPDVPVTKPKSMEPTFMKEGELAFLNADGDTIKLIDIEIAGTEAERNQGLMYRKSMKENHGMLFIMDEFRPQSFWMHNTHISLDIIYLDIDSNIVSVQKYTEPYSDASLPSNKPAKFVVEVIAGFYDKYGLKEGDRMSVKQGG